jgi:hypothetical protein
MDVLVADAERVVGVTVVPARVIKICRCPGCVKTESRGRRDMGSFYLFPGIGERINSERGSGVVGNSERAEVDGNR